MVLFGSAAEGRLRATSDVNIILVLERFERTVIDGLRDATQLATTAIRLNPMFLIEGEIGPAVDAFAVKFEDILRRRRVLYGPDPFAGASVPRRAAIIRLRQVLLNLVLRMRQQYVLHGLHEERLALLVADAAGPLRASAVALLKLQGVEPPTPAEALRVIAGELNAEASEVLDGLSEARQQGRLPAGTAAPVMFGLIRLAEQMRARASDLPDAG